MVISFDDFNKKHEELKQYKNLILNKINDYIKFNISLNSDFIKKHLLDLPNVRAYDFYAQRGDYSLIVQYNYGANYLRHDELYFTRNDYNDLLDFMNDPEQYKIKKEAKKYNL